MTKHVFNVYETLPVLRTYEVELDTDNPDTEEIIDAYLNGAAKLLGESMDADIIEYEYVGLIKE